LNTRRIKYRAVESHWKRQFHSSLPGWCCLSVLCGLGICADLSAAEVVIGDAYARQSADAQSWAIGTSAIEQVFDSEGGQFRLNSFKNKLANPARDYVNGETAGAPFALDIEPFAGKEGVEAISRLPRDFNQWAVEKSEASQVNAGGRPARLRHCLVFRRVGVAGKRGGGLDAARCGLARSNLPTAPN